ncbi:MAG: FecR domain-containing protein [Gammaproteobacteria bacterium]
MNLVDSIQSVVRFARAPRRERRLRRCAREARVWIGRLASADERVQEEFADWLLECPEAVEAWLELTAISAEWAELIGSQFVRVIAPPPGPAPFHVPPGRRETPRPHRVRLVACGAAATVMAGVAGVWLSSPSSTVYAAAIGEHRKLILEDGTAIDLNTRSKIAVRFSARERLVELTEGEALFDIAHDPRPFRVRVAAMTVEDIGTQFSVRNDEKHLSVLVASGRVSIRPTKRTASATVNLAAGDLLEQGESRLPRLHHLDRAAINRSLSWVNGVLIFQGEPLGHIAAELNRYNREELLIDPKIANLQLGGQFRTVRPLAFAEAVQRVRSCKIEQDVARDGHRIIRISASE